MVPMPRGLKLAEGTAVIVLPLDWLATASMQSHVRTKSKVQHRFASEDLIGCNEGDGKSATNDAARSRLSKRTRQQPL
jgi:hypothetical protein